ncbi:MAG: carbohydrate kinase family protein [Promethearchaeati archaeon SRVP18_Atabeyarchaeia-1]
MAEDAEILTKHIESLSKHLADMKSKVKVTIMPDFFFDHLIFFDGSFKSLQEQIETVANQGGGNIPSTTQCVMRGGNSVNCVSALAVLGAQVTFIGRTSGLGLHLLKYLLPYENVDLSGVKTDGELALTVALEAKVGGRRSNVMLNYPGSVSDFGPESLTGEDWEKILGADMVCCFNWLQNRKGTKLAEAVFRKTKAEGGGKTYFDTCDPSSRSKDIDEVMKGVLKKPFVDIFGMNENEACWFAAYFDKSFSKRRKTQNPNKLAIEAAALLFDKLKLRIDLHTIDYAATFSQGNRFVAPGFDVKVGRVTGAGDAWNAGNIFGELAGMPHIERLLLANAAAAYYIENSEGKHATREDLLSFLQKAKAKAIRVESIIEGEKTSPG